MDTIIETRAHIQNISDARYIQKHWGYPDRALPCVKDAGTCEYLDSVYKMHDISMLYTFILWAAIGGLLIIFVGLRVLRPNGIVSDSEDSEGQSVKPAGGAFYRGWRAIVVKSRSSLLPEFGTKFFGHTTRLQILVLALLLTYLLIFSLVGITYKTWYTPVKGTSLTNTRTGFGGFGDRVGALAYALTPLTVLLSTRESVLSILTGIPYQSFNFIHRWLGRIMLVQAIIHTFAWTLIEGNFYKPQPSTYQAFIKEPYIIWGCVALGLLVFLYIFSLNRVIKLTGYEFFRKSHYIVAGVYFGACWAHWDKLACWMIASLGLWLVDRGVRLLRVALIHTGRVSDDAGFGFHPAQAILKHFDDEHGGVVRLDFNHKKSAWRAGQHFYLSFPALSIWQSHPMTTASAPTAEYKHTYIIRCRKGETGKLGDLAKTLSSTTTPVVLDGPYGKPMLNPGARNVLLVAGGTGITLTLPLAFAAIESSFHSDVEIVWSIRHEKDIQWIAQELEELKSLAATVASKVRIQIFVTQDGSRDSNGTVSQKEKNMRSDIKEADCSSLDSVGDVFTVTRLPNRHPDMESIVKGFVEGRHDRTVVVGSGPTGMGHDLRAAVARCNDAMKVWKADESGDVELKWDSRG